MAQKSFTLCVAMVILLMTISDSVSQMSSESVEKVNNGLSFGETAVEFISNLGDSEKNKMFSSLGKMASFLGAAGGLVSFALSFVPKAQSDELIYMKEKFAEVNRKLDKITTELDNVKDLITYENQRAIYVTSASNILSAHKQLLAFLDELQKINCEEEGKCKREKARIAYKYVNEFNVKKDIFKILNGAVKNTEIFGESLLNLIKKTFKCNVGKIDRLANGILKLAFKAQQAILVYDKLIGGEITKVSIAQSMNDWLKPLYDLRDGAFIAKKQCFDRINDYMIGDINDKKYQFYVSSNNKANEEVKKFMDNKYNWLGWVSHSYDGYGNSKHFVRNVYGNFWNMPGNEKDRKRNLIVTPIDKSGTYSDQKDKVKSAINRIVSGTDFSYIPAKQADRLLNAFEHDLRLYGVWKYITTLNVLREYNNLQIKADNDLTYISEEYTLKSYYERDSRILPLKLTFKTTVRLVIILKSLEEANGRACNIPCENNGRCEKPPHSSAAYCQCKPYFQGDKCEDHARALLAKTMDAMLGTTLRLPMLSDVAYDIKDLREYIGINFGTVQSAISELEVVFKKAFENLGRKLSNQFQWTNLITQYSSAISNIKFYAYRFEDLPTRYPKSIDDEGKKLAERVLAADGVEKWLYEINYLILGIDIPLLKHQSLMIVFMNRYESRACSPEYKAAVDNTWRQLVLLQQMGFMLWAQALGFMGRPTGHTEQLYKTRTAKQVSTFNRMTCELSISNSINVQCSGGRYLHPGMNIDNHCIKNYYVTGAMKTTCVSKVSGCSFCGCNAAGSKNQECSDLSGQCSCKDGFYGKKCENRDCKWSSWSDYSTCSKGCGYKVSKMTSTRWHKVTKQGQGKSCSGSNTRSVDCFNNCCKDQFHCLSAKKCIPSNQKCNYDNDCGDHQDEQSCKETCSSKHTGWNDGGGGDVVYLDRHHVRCPGDHDVIQMFHLIRDGNNIRYDFKCCTLLKSICDSRDDHRTTDFNHDGEGNTFYLDRHRVTCGHNGFLRGFRLERDSIHYSVRYNYHCCYHRARTSCYKRHTGFSDGGKGKNFFLDRHTVQCKPRYFLTIFQLQRNSGQDKLQYEYECCTIIS